MKVIGFRKLFVVTLGMTYGFILALLSKLTPEFASIVSIGVASFAAANAFNKRATSPNNSTSEG